MKPKVAKSVSKFGHLTILKGSEYSNFHQQKGFQEKFVKHVLVLTIKSNWNPF